MTSLATVPPWTGRLASSRPYGDPAVLVLATGARESATTGRCALCAQAVRRGERVATLADGSGTAHLPCIGAGHRQ